MAATDRLPGTLRPHAHLNDRSMAVLRWRFDEYTGVDTVRLDWTGVDVTHVERHGVSRAEIDDMIALEWWEQFPDVNGGPARRLLIGYSERGRIITLVVHLAQETHGRPRVWPVTCWPATAAERAAFQRRFWNRRSE
jgi:hypothetical protein